jgi:secretion/DNA translocation related TadE-like protein
MRRPEDRGSATVVVVGALAVLVFGFAAAVTGAAIADASARAQGVADVAAIAAATIARDERALGRIGGSAPCARAELVARANGVALAACDLTARGVVVVAVNERVGGGPGGLVVTRLATAGPASTRP